VCERHLLTTTPRSTHQTNIRVVIAANVFINAGVLILIIINLIFAQRILRASHPRLGWHRSIHFAFLAFYFSIILLLGGLITALVQQVYTLDTHIRSIDHTVQLVGVTYFAAAAFVPILLVVFGLILPKRTRVEKFGSGRFRTKIQILLLSSALISLGASFRAAVSYMPRPRTDTAWFDSKPCFYLFNFTIEIIVIFLYAIVRVDMRFHVPNGSHGPGHYSNGIPEKYAAGDLEIGEGASGMAGERPRMVTRVYTEEELFDDEATVTPPEASESGEWEKRAKEEASHGIEGAPSANHVAFTSPINPPGATPVLTRNQLWAGLRLKIRSAESFVPAGIEHTTVISETADPVSGNPVTVREVTFVENKRKVKETVTAYEDSNVEFVQPDGSRITNVISEGGDGGLYMTYVFEWRHPDASKEELAVLREKEMYLSKLGVEQTIATMRKLAEDGTI
jgi:hypothetical protein